MNLLEIARTYYDSGLNVLPALKEQKRPVGRWKEFAKNRPKFDVAFPPNGKSFDALAVVCGATSGGLEIIDFDLSGRLYPAFRDKVGDLIGALVVETTQRGGVHVAFRSASCARNQKLASVFDGCAIETRGEGGICIVAPTPGYELLYGAWTSVPTISDDQRAFLFGSARSLDETPTEEPVSSVELPQAPPSSPPRYGESPADYVKRIEAGKEALCRHGWTWLYDDSTWEYWARPNQPVAGKVGGEWHKEDGYFHVFTSSAAPLEMGKNYSHLQLIATLDFGGDVSAASKHWIGLTSKPKTNRVIETVDSDYGDVEGGNFDSDEFFCEPVKPDPTAEAVEFPEALYKCGGMIEEIQALANDLAIRPQPEGSFLGALCSMSYLAGRSLALNYASTLVTPNIYGLFLAPSGMGKEAIRRVASEIAKAYNPGEPAPESFASVQALQNMIARVRKIYWIHDEFGRDLAVMSNSKNNSNVAGVITESLKLYSNANNRSYLPKLIAQEAKGVKRPEPVDRPSLTIFATGNPREYYDAASDALLRNGYVARFTTVAGRVYSEKKTTNYEEAISSDPFDLPASFKSRIKSWADIEMQSEQTPFIVPFERAAFDAIHTFDAENEERIKQASLSGDGTAEMRARTFEKVWKYALVFAASKYGATGSSVVDRECAEYAVLLVDYEMRLFQANADRFSDTEQSKFVREIADWLQQRGSDLFTLSEFTRKFQRKDRQARFEALYTLEESGIIEQINIDQGRKKEYLVKL